AALAMRTGSIVRGPPRVAPGRWRGPPPVTLRVRRCANRAPGLDEESMPLPALLAPPLRSQLDTRSETFAENRAAMLEKLAELDRLLDQAEAGGGAYHHERLAKRGKLPVRERIALALDPDSPFLEISPLAAYDSTYPVGGGAVLGIGVIAGVECVIFAND